MNICFVIGKIISEIEFKFIINSKNVSISYFKIELFNKSIINIINIGNDKSTNVVLPK